MDGSMREQRNRSERRTQARHTRGAALALLVAGLVLGPAVPGWAHGPLPGSERLSERDLRALETRLLGTEHAAEHAAMRAAARRAERAAARAAARRRRQGKAGRLRGAPVDRSSGRAPRRLSAAGPPEAVGAWDGAPRVITRNGRADESMPAIHSILLPTGKVLMFGPPLGPATPREPRINESVAVLFDPVTRTFEDVPPPVDPRTGLRSNIYCSGASLLSDGRVLLTGGYLDFDQSLASNNKGLNHTWTFDPWTKQWQRHENLGGGNDPNDITGGRWYPSQMLMPDGRTAIFMGITETGSSGNWTVEVFDPAKPLGNELDTLSGTITRFGNGTDVVLYPKTFWLPSGRGYVVGPSKLNSFFMRAPAPLDFTRTDAGDPLRERTYASGVLLPLAFDSGAGRVMVAGGSSHPNNDDDPGNDVPGANNFLRVPAVASTELFDETANRWTAGPSLNEPRGHHNTVLLPDSGMVTVGGGVGGSQLWQVSASRAERQVELFDGTRWVLGPAQAESRAYHSTAVLLPDGSVLSAGDDNPQATDTSPQLDTYEVYKPSYFFRGARPAITAAPAATGYAATFPVGTPNTDVARAVLAAPGAATHATDMSQRIVTLPVTRRADGSGYDVRSPANRNIALPGHYMLFLVDAQGRPSTATWIALGTDPKPGEGLGTVPVDRPPPAPPVPRPPGARKLAIRSAVATGRLRTVRRRGRLVVRVGIGERGRARMDVRLQRVRGTGKKARTATLARWQRRVRFTRAGRKTVTFKLTRAQRRKLRGHIRVRIAVRATGASGRTGARTTSQRLR